MAQEDRKCENCGRKLFREGFIPFNGGMIVCHPCFVEWQELREPETVAEYHNALWQRGNRGSDSRAENQFQNY